MNSLTDDALYLALNESTDIHIVCLADGYQRFMDIWIELGSYVLSFEGHLGELLCRAVPIFVIIKIKPQFVLGDFGYLSGAQWRDQRAPC